MNNNLTKREIEILKLVLEERTSQSIAVFLNLSIRTIETHRKNILGKTNCQSLVGLLKFAIKTGLIDDYFYKHDSYKRNKQNT